MLESRTSPAILLWLGMICLVICFDLALLRSSCANSLPPEAAPFALASYQDSTDADTVIVQAPNPSSLPDPADGDWARLPLTTESPWPPRRMHAEIVYDSASGRIVIFGGWNGTSGLGDLRCLQLRPVPAWVFLRAQGTSPGPRWAHTATYDPLRRRILYFGGATSTGATNELWALDLNSNPATWTLLHPEGSPPTPRSGHKAVYDSKRGRLVIFGGNDGSHRNEVWELSLSPTLTWTQLFPTGPVPPPRSGHVAIYDAKWDRMVIFGGANSTVLNDGYILNFASLNWQVMAPPGPVPSARTLAAAIYDSKRQAMWMWGGTAEGQIGEQTNWLLQLDFAPVWSAASNWTSPPQGRWGHGAILDPVADQMVIFGGHDFFNFTDNAWSTPLGSLFNWVEIFPETHTEQPLPKFGHTLFFDSHTDRVVQFGGGNNVNEFNDCWGLPLSDPTHWVDLSPTGTPPSPRVGHSTAYDSKRNRLIVFGGYDGAFRNDVWTLDLTSPPVWTRLVPSGTAPSGRDAHGSVYDAVGDRLVVFGGWDNANRLSDVWTLSLQAPLEWRLESGLGPPIPGRFGFGYAYDPSRNSMWVVGGQTQRDVGTNDVWRLSLADMTWIPIVAQGTPPLGRWGHSIVYDGARDRLLLWGGFGASGYDNDLWELSLTGAPVWRERIPQGQYPDSRHFEGLALDPTRNWLVIHGGASSGIFGDAWVWQFDLPTPSLPSWVSSRLTPDGLEITWMVPDGSPVDVQRRTESTDWSDLSWASDNGGGQVVYLDRTAVAGIRYGYRIVVAGEAYGEIWVQAAGNSLSLSGFPSTPSQRGSPIMFTLEDESPARLEIFDLRGRRVFSQDVGALGPGRHSVDVQGASLRAGIYWIQLRQGLKIRKQKAVVLP